MRLSTLACIAATVAVATPASASTTVCGPIDVDTTWTLAGSPYIVTCSVIVRNNATLTIEPGVEVRFAAYTTLWVGTVPLGGGTLIADGQGGDAIRFTANVASPGPGYWNGIEFLESAVGATVSGHEYVSGSILRNCIIEYPGPYAIKAGSPPAIIDCIFRGTVSGVLDLGTGPLTEMLMVGCRVENTAGVVRTSGGHVKIINCSFINSATTILSSSVKLEIADSIFENNTFAEIIRIERGAGSIVRTAFRSNITTGGTIRVSGGSVDIQCSVIENNQSASNVGGVHLEGGQLVMSSTSLTNYGLELRNDTSGSPDVRNNWWGTTNPTQIEAEIFDCFESPFVNCAQFHPFLLQPVAFGACGGTIAVEGVTWGSLKSRYR